jgi:hypothetical protein
LHSTGVYETSKQSHSGQKVQTLQTHFFKTEVYFDIVLSQKATQTSRHHSSHRRQDAQDAALLSRQVGAPFRRKYYDAKSAHGNLVGHVVKEKDLVRRNGKKSILLSNPRLEKRQRQRLARLNRVFYPKRTHNSGLSVMQFGIMEHDFSNPRFGAHKSQRLAR